MFLSFSKLWTNFPFSLKLWLSHKSRIDPLFLMFRCSCETMYLSVKCICWKRRWRGPDITGRLTVPTNCKSFPAWQLFFPILFPAWQLFFSFYGFLTTSPIPKTISSPFDNWKTFQRPIMLVTKRCDAKEFFSQENVVA